MDLEIGPHQRRASVVEYVAVQSGKLHDTTRRLSLAPGPAIDHAATTDLDTVHQPDATLRKLSVAVPNLADLTTDAKHGADREKQMGFRESFRMYPMGVFFSFGLSLAIIMEGYDTALLGSFWQQPAFAEKYGELKMQDGVETYVVSASWQQAVTVTSVSSMIGLMPKLSASVGWAIGALMLVETFVYDITVGPVCYSLVAELPSTRLRIKTVVISRTVYNLAGILIGLLQPQFMNPTSWNWVAKTSLLWAGVNLLGLCWTYFRLPEPKGLTYADLDVLFENKVSACDFTKVRVDPYRSNNLVAVTEESSEVQVGVPKHG